MKNKNIFIIHKNAIINYIIIGYIIWLSFSIVGLIMYPSIKGLIIIFKVGGIGIVILLIIIIIHKFIKVIWSKLVEQNKINPPR